MSEPPPGNLVGRTYYERGQPVVILVQWASYGQRGPRPHAPRNVRIRRADGTEVVRPFRGLRKAPA